MQNSSWRVWIWLEERKEKRCSKVGIAGTKMWVVGGKGWEWDDLAQEWGESAQPEPKPQPWWVRWNSDLSTLWSQSFECWSNGSQGVRSFNQQVGITCLLCARHSARSWGCESGWQIWSLSSATRETQKIPGGQGNHHYPAADRAR